MWSNEAPRHQLELTTTFQIFEEASYLNSLDSHIFLVLFFLVFDVAGIRSELRGAAFSGVEETDILENAQS